MAPNRQLIDAFLQQIRNDEDAKEEIRDAIGLKQFESNVDGFFLVVMAIHVHIMQYGFACLEAGCVRAQSATNSMWKNCISAYCAAICFWLFGYALAFGNSSDGGFAGSTFWAFTHIDNINNWFFQFSFCATASTIMSGAIAERSHIGVYTIASCLMSSFYYPICVHWAWHDQGWLKVGRDGVGYLDFAGSGVIHVVGGAASLAAIMVVPARRGRFTGNNRQEFYGHSTTLASLGCMILATGFIAFNAGSQLQISGEGSGEVIGTAAANTVLSGAGGMIAVGVAVYIKTKMFPVMPLHCGLLAGNVAICAGCDDVDGWAAVVIGIFAGLVYFFVGWLIEKAELDDPVEAVAVHGGGGVAGLFAYAFLKKDYGIFYNWDETSGRFLGWQLCGMLSMGFWSFGITYGIFWLFRWINVLNAKSDNIDDSNIDEAHGHEPATDTVVLKKMVQVGSVSNLPRS